MINVILFLLAAIIALVIFGTWLILGELEDIREQLKGKGL